MRCAWRSRVWLGAAWQAWRDNRCRSSALSRNSSAAAAVNIAFSRSRIRCASAATSGRKCGVASAAITTRTPLMSKLEEILQAEVSGEINEILDEAEKQADEAAIRLGMIALGSQMPLSPWKEAQEALQRLEEDAEGFLEVYFQAAKDTASKGVFSVTSR